MGQVPIIGTPGKREGVDGVGRDAGGRRGGRRARDRRGAWIRQPGGGRLWVPAPEERSDPAADASVRAAAVSGDVATEQPASTGATLGPADSAPGPGSTTGPGSTSRVGERQLSPAVTRLREAGQRCSADEAELIASARGVVDQVRVTELSRRGIEDPSHPSAETRAVARAVRATAIGEIEVALGFGVREAGLLVRAATAPGELYAMVEDALRRGEANWAQVRSFYEKTATLAEDARLLAASALFGTDPAMAAADRLDPDDKLHGRPWSAPHFTAALDAQIAACRSKDVEAERAARARAYAARRMRIRVHDDGTATMYITGPTAMVVAAGQRVERGARSVNAIGDPRTLDQLRVDIALGNLIYATIELGATSPHTNPAPQTGTDDTGDEGHGATDSRTTEDGTPDDRPAEDGTPDDRPTEDGTTRDRPTDAGTPQDRTPEDDAARAATEERSCSCGESDADHHSAGQGQLFDDLVAPDDMELLARAINGLPPVALQVVVPFSTLAGGFPVCAHCSGRVDARQPRPDGTASRQPGHQGPQEGSVSDPPQCGAPGERGGLAEVLGANPFFISDGHARELALMPGTTLHRLVVDPRDGRLVERTIKAYKPDADMRRQVVAADVYSRAPGSRTGSYAGELDHVTPYGWAGGTTSELNLALLAKRPHQRKTDGTLRVTIGARRDLTFTTLLGQVVTTRVFDYRTFLDQRHPDDLDDRRDAAGQLVQAALADGARRRGRRRGDMVTLDHTDADTGRTRPGPRPDQPTLDELLEQDGHGGGDGAGQDGSDEE